MSQRVVAILGGSRGIGAATATLLAGQGWQVALGARDGAACHALAQKLGPQVLGHQVDAADHTSVVAFADAVEARFGRIDGLFANAGKILGTGAIDALTTSDVQAALNANFFTAFNALNVFLPRLARGDGGAVVINTARSGLRGMAGFSAYSAAKAAAIMLSQVAAVEAGPMGVRVNAIAPGFIATDAWLDKLGAHQDALAANVPLRRIGAPEHVAQLVAWLLSPVAAYLSGAVIPIDGGTTAS